MARGCGRGRIGRGAQVSRPGGLVSVFVCVHTISFTANNVTLMSLVNPTGNDAKCSFSILQSCKRRVTIDRLSRKLFL